MMELPSYRMPHPRDIAIGLYERAMIFLRRVGGIILALTVLLWFLSSFPAPPAGATDPAINYSLAGRLGHLLQYVFTPLGFNWQICIALIPGLAAREVAVSSLATVYALSGNEAGLLGDRRRAVVARDRAFAAGLVRLRADVHLDAGDDPPRDEFVAPGVDHGRLSVRSCVCRVAGDVPDREGARHEDVRRRAGADHRARRCVERLVRLASPVADREPPRAGARCDMARTIGAFDVAASSRRTRCSPCKRIPAAAAAAAARRAAPARRRTPERRGAAARLPAARKSKRLSSAAPCPSRRVRQAELQSANRTDAASGAALKRPNVQLRDGNVHASSRHRAAAGQPAARRHRVAG